MQYVILSHDVDWNRNGASRQHIMDRKDRFDKNVIDNLDKANPYYNIPEYIEIEENYGVKSTFFFRTKYENGSLLEYSDDINELLRLGWEIGLHLDPSSIDDFKKIKMEKEKLEKISRTTIKGNRVHYLGFNDTLLNKLNRLGFDYDSTMMKEKNSIHDEQFGYKIKHEMIEFPITIMDAYLFTYMNITESQMISVFEKTLERAREMNDAFNIITVNWHDCVLKMKGGRMYEEIIEFLFTQDDVKMCKANEVATKLSHLKTLVSPQN